MRAPRASSCVERAGFARASRSDEQCHALAARHETANRVLLVFAECRRGKNPVDAIYVDNCDVGIPSSVDAFEDARLRAAALCEVVKRVAPWRSVCAIPSRRRSVDGVLREEAAGDSL